MQSTKLTATAKGGRGRARRTLGASHPADGWTDAYLDLVAAAQQVEAVRRGCDRDCGAPGHGTRPPLDCKRHKTAPSSAARPPNRHITKSPRAYTRAGGHTTTRSAPASSASRARGTGAEPVGGGPVRDLARPQALQRGERAEHEHGLGNRHVRVQADRTTPCSKEVESGEGGGRSRARRRRGSVPIASFHTREKGPLACSE